MIADIKLKLVAVFGSCRHLLKSWRMDYYRPLMTTQQFMTVSYSAFVMLLESFQLLFLSDNIDWKPAFKKHFADVQFIVKYLVVKNIPILCEMIYQLLEFYLIITYCVSCTERKMYCGHTHLCVCLCVCPRPHAYTIAWTQM